MENSRNKQFLGSKLHALLSSVMKPCTIPLHPIWDMKHPFVPCTCYICSPSIKILFWLNESSCIKGILGTHALHHRIVGSLGVYPSPDILQHKPSNEEEESGALKKGWLSSSCLMPLLGTHGLRVTASWTELNGMCGVFKGRIEVTRRQILARHKERLSDNRVAIVSV